VRLVVLHTAEGALTYQSLGNYFASSSSGVSSHTGIDDTPGVIGEYVRRDLKAWTQGNANPYSVAAELCAFAAWTGEWAQHPTMLENTAAWIAEECAAFNIPVRRLSAAEAQGGAAGVCQHVDLGAAGGGHWDCGPGFPMEQVIEMAAGGAAPSPPDESEDVTMRVITRPDGRQYITDGVTKRYVGEPTMESPDLLKLCGQTVPVELADYTIDRMPEILPVGTPDSVQVDLENIDRGAE
jgi:hypothetical protein